MNPRVSSTLRYPLRTAPSSQDMQGFRQTAAKTSSHSLIRSLGEYVWPSLVNKKSSSARCRHHENARRTPLKIRIYTRPFQEYRIQGGAFQPWRNMILWLDRRVEDLFSCSNLQICPIPSVSYSSPQRNGAIILTRLVVWTLDT